MSIFLTTPVTAFLLWQWRKTWLFGVAWLTIALLLVPLLTYYNTGWWQFGYRFALDFMPLLLLLWAHTARKPEFSRLFKTLIMASVVINLLGTVWFGLITGHTLVF